MVESAPAIDMPDILTVLPVAAFAFAKVADVLANVTVSPAIISLEEPDTLAVVAPS